MSYAKIVGGVNLYTVAKRNGVAMRTLSKYGQLTNINSGLIGWWKLDEASGTSAYDSSGNAITGTLVNTPQWCFGKVNNALQFYKASFRYVTLASNAALNMGSGNFTFAAWINPSTYDINGWRAMLGSVGNDAAAFGIVDTPNRHLKLTKVNVVDFATGTQVITPDTWQHVAVVMNRSASSLTYYLNGVADVVAYSATTFTAQTDRIGCRRESGSDPFDGAIDDVRIYNRALSADDITALYAVRPPNYIDGYAGPRLAEPQLIINSSGESDYRAQCITLAKATTITSVKVAVRKNNSPTGGNVTAYLFATTGTVGTDAKATGSPLATSVGVAATALPTSDNSPMVEFTFATPYLAAAGDICIAIGYGGTGWQEVLVQHNNSSPTHPGNSAYRNGSTQVWYAANTMDMLFEVYGY